MQLKTQTKQYSTNTHVDPPFYFNWLTVTQQIQITSTQSRKRTSEGMASGINCYSELLISRIGILDINK